MSRRLTAVVILLALLCPVRASRAQGVVVMPLRTAILWKTANDLATAFVLAGMYRQEKDKLAQMLAAARSAYWDQFPNGAGLETARKGYAAALLKKDLWNADQMMMQRGLAFQDTGGLSTAGVQHVREALRGIEMLTGGRVERTIPLADEEFVQWATALFDARVKEARESLTDRDLRASAAAYERYTARRDLGEYLFYSSGSPLRVTTSARGDFLAAWMAAVSREPQTLEQAAAFVAGLRSAVGEQKIAHAARVVRSYVRIEGDSVEGPLSALPAAYLNHVTGRSRFAAAPALDAPLRVTLQEVDKRMFEMRSQLDGLKEEAAVDRLRELLVRVVANRDTAALAQAAADGRALDTRVRNRIGGIIGNPGVDVTLRMMPSYLHPIDVARDDLEQRNAWAGIVKGEAPPFVSTPETDAAVARELATYRGPSAAKFQVCAMSGQSGPVLDGLPNGQLTVIGQGNRPLAHELTPGGAGHQRLRFPNTRCAAGEWAPAGTSAATSAVSTATDDAFRRAQTALARTSEAAAVQPIADKWREFQTTNDTAARRDAIRLKTELLERLYAAAAKSPAQEEIVRHAIVIFQAALPFVNEPYSGPASGEVIWTGDGRGWQQVEIVGNRANVGKVQGAFPGVRIAIEVAEVRAIDAQLREFPNVSDGYRRVMLSVAPKIRRVVIRWRVL